MESRRITSAGGERSEGKGKRNDGKGKGKDRPHPRQDSAGRYITTTLDRNICFDDANGGCQEPCPRGMAHGVCQWCLGAHRTKDHQN